MLSTLCGFQLISRGYLNDSCYVIPSLSLMLSPVLSLPSRPTLGGSARCKRHRYSEASDWPPLQPHLLPNHPFQMLSSTHHDRFLLVLLFDANNVNTGKPQTVHLHGRLQSGHPSFFFLDAHQLPWATVTDFWRLQLDANNAATQRPQAGHLCGRLICF